MDAILSIYRGRRQDGSSMSAVRSMEEFSLDEFSEPIEKKAVVMNRAYPLLLAAYGLEGVQLDISQRVHLTGALVSLTNRSARDAVAMISQPRDNALRELRGLMAVQLGSDMWGKIKDQFYAAQREMAATPDSWQNLNLAR